jgi:hypothetical protein
MVLPLLAHYGLHSYLELKALMKALISFVCASFGEFGGQSLRWNRLFKELFEG